LQFAYRESISAFIEKRRPSTPAVTEESVGFVELVMRSMETMQASISQFKLAANAPAVVIRIPRNLCGFFEFHRARELIDFGYQRAQQAMKDYERNTLIPSRGRLI
jgi:NTE family protein